jgi:hypothetical protein
MSATIFHKSPPPWFEDVQHLKPGGRRRLGDGKLVSFNGKGYHLYDFREKQSEVYEPELTLAEKLTIVKQRREADIEALVSTEPPLKGAMMHPQDWPLEARVWFYQAGINNDEIGALGAFWSPPMGRVVLPYRTVFGQDAWIARDPFWHKMALSTKYLFPAGVKRGGGAWFYDTVDTLGEVGIVITEDALSAYRVMRDTDFAAVAAQGTSLDRDAVVWIAGRDVPVVTWLDPDRYGQLGATKLRQQFSNLGLEVRNIKSPRDPKNHEPNEIREALET